MQSCPGSHLPSRRPPAGLLPPAPQGPGMLEEGGPRRGPKAHRRGCVQPEPDLSLGCVTEEETEAHCRASLGELPPSVHADPAASWGPSLGATQAGPGTRGPQPGSPGPGPAGLRLLVSGGHSRPWPLTRPCLPQLLWTPGGESWSLLLQGSHLPKPGSQSLPAGVRCLTPQPAPSGPPTLGQDGRLHGLGSPASHDLISPQSSRSLPDKSQACPQPPLWARSPYCGPLGPKPCSDLSTPSRPPSLLSSALAPTATAPGSPSCPTPSSQPAPGAWLGSYRALFSGEVEPRVLSGCWGPGV